MSTEPDKESFSLKRHRGAEGGLGGLGGSGLILGSPDKKRRRSSTQTPSFSPLSEYAPPPNPGSDHLIAANPFDDGYSLSSVRSLPSVNPNFAHSQYSGFSGYGSPRMGPHMGSRMPSPYPYQMRNQTHPFSQNPMGFNRPPGFNYGHPENPNHGHQFGSNMQLPQIHPFRTGPAENVNQIPLQNLNHSNSPDGGPEGNPPSVKPAPDVSPKLTPLSETLNKNTTQNQSLRKQNQNCEDSTAQDSTADLKGKSRGDGRLEKLNGVLKKSPRADKVSRGSGNNNKPQNRSNRRSASSSSEPVYPCGICLSEVNDDQEAILCEASCQKWFHRVCTGMTETAYNLLTAEMSAVWGCDSCMEDKGAQLLKSRDAPGTPSGNSDGQS